MQVMTENKTLPKLRFGEFDKDWKFKKIQKLLDEGIILSHLDGNHGALYPKSEEFTKEGVPYVTANDFIDGFVDINGCRCLPENRAKQFKKGISRNGDVLFAHNATVGPTAILITKLDYVILSTTATYYRCNIEKLDNKFLVKVFESTSFVKQYSRVMSQSTRNQVPITMQRTFFIPFPSLPEQQKIATFLSAVDEKLQQLTKKKDLLEEYKKGVMQQIFSQELRFKDEFGNNYPNWEEKRIGEIFEERNEKNFINMELLSISIKKGIFPQSESNKNDNSNSDKSKYKRVLIGDIAYNSMRMWQGASAVSKLNGIISPAYTVLKSNNFNCSEYFGYLFKMSFMIQTFQKHSQGLTSDTWNLKYQMISKIKINVPSLEEQQKIANFLSSLDSKIALVSTQIENTKAFKKGLLQQMFV